MRKKTLKSAIFLVIMGIVVSPLLALAQTDFNPQFILSDQELQDVEIWTRTDVQNFLDSKGSYLRNFKTADVDGTPKMATDIIFDAAHNYQINPKYLLVTLQKEQSLITDDSPTLRQLNWAMGYGVCDGCSMDDPKIQKFRGFGKQVDNAAGIMRYYYNNETQSFVKKKDISIRVDNTDVTPGSWATAFLYTYTPHLHGNKNFWRIWNTWFQQVYPNGTLLQSAEMGDFWQIQDNIRRRFKNRTALITRADPKLAIIVPNVELENYKIGPEINFPNYSVLRNSSATYLLDYDTLRPFATPAVVNELGYNPQEIIDVADSDLAGYNLGKTIAANSTAPAGVIYQITDLKNAYYLLKDSVLTPITNKQIIDTNYKTLPIEKHKQKELANFQIANVPITFNDGSLLQTSSGGVIYVIDHGQRRRIADEEAFRALGYKHSNVITVNDLVMANFPEGDQLFLNGNLLSASNKFLGDDAATVIDQYGESKVPEYLVAEYPSGRIISGKNIDTPRLIASLTKLPVAYEALEQNFNFKKTTTYDVAKYDTGPNPLRLTNGDTINNQDLFFAMLTASNNSAARMVAAGTGFSEGELIKKINLRLEEWGADNTVISDVTGLGDADKSTARDLLKIFTKVVSKKLIITALGNPTYDLKITLNKKNHKIITQKIKNTNQLFGLKNKNYRILASKTGYTDQAGALMIMLIQSQKTKKQYVVLSMGNSDYKNRFEEPNKIATWIAKGEIKIAKNEGLTL